MVLRRSDPGYTKHQEINTMASVLHISTDSERRFCRKTKLGLCLGIWDLGTQTQQLGFELGQSGEQGQSALHAIG